MRRTYALLGLMGVGLLGLAAACNGKVSNPTAVDGGAPDTGTHPVDASGPADSGAPEDTGRPTDAAPDSHVAADSTTPEDGSADAPEDVPPTPGFDGGPCSPSLLAQRWALMDRQPIVPLDYAGGLDLRSWLTGPGLTVSAAEEVNCQCAPLGDVFGQNGITTCAWGDNQEVLFTYFTSDDTAYLIYLQPGYTGAIGCNGNEPPNSPPGGCKPLMSRDHTHTYLIPIDSQIQKDGANFEIDWLDPVNGVAELDELADALLATYAPQLPANTTCLASGACVMGATGDVPYFGITALGIYISPSSQSAAQPVPSIMTNIQMYGPPPPATDGGAPDAHGD